MATNTLNDQTNIEYIVVKAFLHKYTPQFTQVPLPTPAPDEPRLASFDAFSVELDDTKYYTRYDISDYVTSYSFEQNIDETTYSWSLELQDAVLSYSTIDHKLKVPSPTGGNTKGLSFTGFPNSINLLAQYELNANNFLETPNNNVSLNSFSLKAPTIFNIIAAKEFRGLSYPQLTVQNVNLLGALSQIPGLRLSDLVQEYDFITVYIYKNNTPITDITGTFYPGNKDNGLNVNDPTVVATPSTEILSLTNTENTNNPLPYFVQTSNTTFSDAFNPSGSTVQLSNPNLKYDTVLSSPMLNGQPFFSNEINGFIMKKVPVRTINQVDRLMISGNGWSRLFGCTKRLMKPSYLTGSLYQAGQVLDMKAVSGYQTVYAGKSIAEIIQDLFDLVFRINFDFAEPVDGVLTLRTSYCNLSSLIIGNTYPANVVNIPAYLLACVMKRQHYNYVEPLNISTFVEEAPTVVQDLYSSMHIKTNTGTGISTDTFQDIMGQVPGQVGSVQFKQPVFFDPSVQNLKAYFKFLAAVWTAKFSPELKTPFEILDEIRKNAFVEIFETPSGVFFIRAPQYNNTATFIPSLEIGSSRSQNPAAYRPDINMVLSSNLNIISNTYSETTDNLVSKVFANFSVDALASVSGLEQFGYCDGKLLDQFGLFETTTVANPNINLKKGTDNSINKNKPTGLLQYCEYFMRILNARLKNIVVICDYDPSVRVGHTFLDITNSRFGYIHTISKQVSVGGTALMTLGITYVRDANIVINSDGTLQSLIVEKLPTLTDLEIAFGGNGSTSSAS